jgi:hypothetical protein
VIAGPVVRRLTLRALFADAAGAAEAGSQRRMR